MDRASATPLVSVLVPAFNAAPFLAEAIGSLLAQTLTDFELIVVNDGSTDETGAIARSFADPRIRVHDLPVNMGEAQAANLGLALARGRYLARLDADDIALPHRLAMQVAELDRRPDIEVLGSNMLVFPKPRSTTTVPGTDAAIKATFMLAAGNLMNPTTCLRMDFVRRHGLRYDPMLRKGVDLAFWIACMRKGARFANLAEPLVRYRIHGGNLSRQAGSVNGIVQDLAIAFFPDLPSSRARRLADLFVPRRLGWTDAIATVEAAALAKDHDRSVFGEDRPLLLRWIEQRANGLRNAVPAAPSPAGGNTRRGTSLAASQRDTTSSENGTDQAPQ
ncbi:glycosyltransferase family A protein [uncultured Alsobacter sp.]|uniref:glycosyltransferase family 2 protein n=1 Tax=uncultured Alsobacter sp. TaxID=1748258 RepID=UPI0025F24822|nr:glycosyltransferase family A protein [uncultured Alsobacter sp.]